MQHLPFYLYYPPGTLTRPLPVPIIRPPIPPVKPMRGRPRFIDLPPDILREYFFTNPEFYGSLSRVQRKYDQIATREDVLKKLSEARPTLKEVVDVTLRILDLQRKRSPKATRIPLVLFHPPPDILPGSEERYSKIFHIFHNAREFQNYQVNEYYYDPVEELSITDKIVAKFSNYRNIIQKFYSSGYLEIIPPISYAIYQRRYRCASVSPNYSMMKVMGEFNNFTNRWISFLTKYQSILHLWMPLECYLCASAALLDEWNFFDEYRNKMKIDPVNFLPVIIEMVEKMRRYLPMWLRRGNLLY